MLILASNLSGASIICGNKGKVEKIDFAIFDQKGYKVEGFVCQKPLNQFFKGSKGLLFNDTISIEHNTVYIDHEKKIELITKNHYLSKYLKENRGEDEYLSLRLMRIYKIGYLLNYYTKSAAKTNGDLHDLMVLRLSLWKKALEAVLNDKALEENILNDYLIARSRLRSPEEKERQKEFAIA